MKSARHRNASSCSGAFIWQTDDQPHFKATATEFLNDLGKAVEGRATAEVQCADAA
jgi:hypothetical protein